MNAIDRCFCGSKCLASCRPFQLDWCEHSKSIGEVQVRTLQPSNSTEPISGLVHHLSLSLFLSTPLVWPFLCDSVALTTIMNPVLIYCNIIGVEQNGSFVIDTLRLAKLVFSPLKSKHVKCMQSLCSFDGCCAFFSVALLSAR